MRNGYAMTEEKRNEGMADAPAPRAVKIEAFGSALDDGADRDMREILASIRRLMKETPAPEPAVLPDMRRRQERARRFETVAAPPSVAVDEWPDDPEIDVDALADELLREASVLAARRATAQRPPTGADPEAGDKPARSGAGEAPKGGAKEAWGELDALLSYAQGALDIEDASGAPSARRSQQDRVEPPSASEMELVAYPTEALPGFDADQIDAMPDLSAVLKTPATTVGETRPAASATASPVEPPLSPAPSTVPAPPSSALSEDAEPSAPEATPAEEPDQAAGPTAGPPRAEETPDELAAVDLAETAEEPPVEAAPEATAAPGGDAVPAPPFADLPAAPASSEAPVAAAPAAPQPAEPPAAAKTPLHSSAAPRMPEDFRNLPGARSHGILDQIGEMVRAQARKNIEQGLSTYGGNDPHPRIVEKIGWKRGPTRAAAEAAANEQSGAPAPASPPLSPKDLALRALEENGAADAVEPPASAPPSIEPGASVASAAATTLRPVLADWLDENLPRLIQELVREEMRRMSGDKAE